MKVHRTTYPELITLTEVKLQVATGALTVTDLLDIIDKYNESKYYLSEEVLTFLEEYLGIVIKNKNKFYLRNKTD